MHSASSVRDGKVGWILAFGAILLLSVPIDRWSGVPDWLASGWRFLASNQAVFAILLAAAVLLKAFVLDRIAETAPRSRRDPLALKPSDRRLLGIVQQLPADIPLAQWAGRALLIVAALLGFRWLRAMAVLETVGEFRTLAGEVFWFSLLVAMGWLSLRLIGLVRALYERIERLYASRD